MTYYSLAGAFAKSSIRVHRRQIKTHALSFNQSMFIIVIPMVFISIDR